MQKVRSDNLISEIEMRVISTTGSYSSWYAPVNTERSRLAHALLTGPVEYVILDLGYGALVEYRLK